MNEDLVAREGESEDIRTIIDEPIERFERLTSFVIHRVLAPVAQERQAARVAQGAEWVHGPTEPRRRSVPVPSLFPHQQMLGLGCPEQPFEVDDRRLGAATRVRPDTREEDGHRRNGLEEPGGVRRRRKVILGMASGTPAPSRDVGDRCPTHFVGRHDAARKQRGGQSHEQPPRRHVIARDAEARAEPEWPRPDRPQRSREAPPLPDLATQSRIVARLDQVGSWITDVRCGTWRRLPPSCPGAATGSAVSNQRLRC